MNTLLHTAFHSAGVLRDTQVAIRQLRLLQVRFPPARRLARHLQHEVPRQRKRAARRVRELPCRRLRKHMESWHLSDAASAKPTLQARALRRLSSAESGLLARVRNQPTARQLHALRIQLKRVRYMMELCRELRFRARPRWSPSRIQRLQDALGEVTDLSVLREFVDGFACRHDKWRARIGPMIRDLDARQAQARGRAMRLATKL